MDGSVSTLAPLFAAAFATHSSVATLQVGLAASVGAGISMGFAEALSDDGSLTGRGHPWVRGLICGLMTTIGGLGHTFPFLIPSFTVAFTVAVIVVLVELAAKELGNDLNLANFSDPLEPGLSTPAARSRSGPRKWNCHNQKQYHH